MNSTIITCVHTCHLWDSHVFTLFVCGMQKIHKHKKVGCALTESLGGGVDKGEGGGRDLDYEREGGRGLDKGEGGVERCLCECEQAGEFFLCSPE